MHVDLPWLCLYLATLYTQVLEDETYLASSSGPSSPRGGGGDEAKSSQL